MAERIGVRDKDKDADAGALCHTYIDPDACAHKTGRGIGADALDIIIVSR